MNDATMRWREAALTAIVSEHSEVIRSVIRRYERNAATVEDLTSDVFHLAFLKIEHLVDLDSIQVRLWLIRTARNLSANWVRRAITSRHLHDRLSREPVEPVPGPEEAHALSEAGEASDERVAMIVAVLQSMRDDYRQVLVMDALGNNGPAIAHTLGISSSAARKRLARARRVFRDSYAKRTDADSGRTTP